MQADPMQQSWDQRTALHVAAQHCHPAVIRQLLLHPSRRPQVYTSSTPASSLVPAQYPGHQNGLSCGQDQTMTAEPPQETRRHTNGMHAAGTQAPVSAEGMQQHPEAAELEHGSMQDAANSLQSLHSGVHYQPYADRTISDNKQEEDPTGSVHAEQLDYTGADADAMDALLALTSDISVQSPPRLQNPAGVGVCLSVCLSVRLTVCLCVCVI